MVLGHTWLVWAWWGHTELVLSHTGLGLGYTGQLFTEVADGSILCG